MGSPACPEIAMGCQLEISLHLPDLIPHHWACQYEIVVGFCQCVRDIEQFLSASALCAPFSGLTWKLSVPVPDLDLEEVEVEACGLNLWSLRMSWVQCQT